ncbi:hypothetical protein CAPTEDRAFT_185035 [Capitella teleta]|uniref:Endonuclease/exonuclease/phosphatase domain-containing protein n=1 Tax=Capitella teleta TaxID=283909 RepID=R7V9R5_CAPTE|nr:hypothetical protein CAPTEDRAFT_185035 [Capitella teleta]|eukprot:ELU13086.1 hypothetical protein CAPTEDRAFT_185035 [Capitella teleta]
MIRQSQMIKEHQIFMEKIDAKDREKNLVVTGVPEGTYLDAKTDEKKLERVVEKLDHIEPSGAIIRLKHLGVQAPDKNRLILCILESVDVRNKMVKAARNASLGGIRMKKDAHPAVRTEWRRLFEIKEAEEKKPENAEKRIRIDLRKCQVICDGQFHSFTLLAEMKNKMSTSPQEKFIIIGDMNARFGESRTGFLQAFHGHAKQPELCLKRFLRRTHLSAGSRVDIRIRHLLHFTRIHFSHHKFQSSPDTPPAIQPSTYQPTRRPDRDAGTPALKYAKALLDNTDAERIDDTREHVLSFKWSKFVTYWTMMKPALTTHPMHTDPTVCEYKRRTLTKFCLSSHD